MKIVGENHSRNLDKRAKDKKRSDERALLDNTDIFLTRENVNENKCLFLKIDLRKEKF